MARVAAYQVLQDGRERPNLPSADAYWTPGARGYEYTFFVPQGLITNRNRARPILECLCRHRPRRDTKLIFSMGGTEVITVNLGRYEKETAREVFDWRTVNNGVLTPGAQVEMRARFAPTEGGDRDTYLSDIVIWYQIDTDLA